MEQPETNRNPDVLECLANLSNDEVFTPPRVANAMLDLLPQELFRNPKTTFLDPCCKSGVFLREIAKRLIKGLEPTFPDLQERLDHIFHRQLFGLAITELTALIARRTVYCSKFADGRYALSHFDAPAGNILLPPAAHAWKGGRCTLCGASAEVFGKRAESHAYAFIHGVNPERLFDMKFDVIIGNPPYQLDDGSDSASATPIYNLFVEQAKALHPNHIVMIIPARWFTGGKGLVRFRETMLRDERLKTIVDYFDSKICFGDGVDISGGVCYFHWQRDYRGLCTFRSVGKRATSETRRTLLFPWSEAFIRFNEALSIVEKVRAKKEHSFALLVSERRPFGLETKVLGHVGKEKGDVRLYASKNATKEPRYIACADVPEKQAWIDRWKVLCGRAYGERGDFPYYLLGKPFLAEPESCCSETYIVIGAYKEKETAEHVASYIRTRFFRFLVLLLKNTQDAPRRVYRLVPLQDFSRPWTDAELYAKYGLTDEEVAFIERMVKPMEA